MGQFLLLHCSKLLKISWMQARIAGDDNIGILERAWLSIRVVGDPDVTLSFVQNFPSITHA